MELLSVRLHSESLLSSLRFAILPILKVLIMCALGYILATKRVGILTEAGIKLLCKLVFLVFLPCLIFTELGTAVTLRKMLQWWFIPVNIVLASVIGCSIGCVVVWVMKPPPQFKKFTIIAVGIGNIGNIPLVLIDSICRDSSSPFGEYETCSESGTAYISYGQWVGAVIVYTFVFHMLSPPKDPDESHYPELEGNSTLTTPFIDKTDDLQESKNIFSRFSLSIRKFTKAVTGSEVVKRLQQIFQPPIMASILALIVGATPFLKYLLLDEDGSLYFFSDCLSIMGDAMIPGIMLALGGTLVGGPGSSELGVRTTVAIVLVRLLVIPAVGIGVVLSAKKLGFLAESDPLFEFVLLLQHSMPSSVLAGSVAALRGVAVKESAAILFYEHIASIVSITLWLVVFLNLLF